MFAVLLALFVVLPILEIYVAIQVAHHIGVTNTLVFLVLFSVGGTWLAKQAGFGVIGRIRGQLDRGVLPGNELLDGVLVFVAGVLLFVPGFVTGVVGLVLLLPPVRITVRNAIVRSLRRRIRRYGIVPSGPSNPGGPNRPNGPTGPGVIDV